MTTPSPACQCPISSPDRQLPCSTPPCRPATLRPPALAAYAAEWCADWNARRDRRTKPPRQRRHSARAANAMDMAVGVDRQVEVDHVRDDTRSTCSFNWRRSPCRDNCSQRFWSGSDDWRFPWRCVDPVKKPRWAEYKAVLARATGNAWPAGRKPRQNHLCGGAVEYRDGLRNPVVGRRFSGPTGIPHSALG